MISSPPYDPSVRISLRPTEDAFYGFFTSAANNIVTASDVLAEILTPGADSASISSRLVSLEHANDKITHDLIRKLNSTFVTPFDREDIYRLASALDDVMDYIESAATFIDLSNPPNLPSEMNELVETISACARTTADAMPRLKSRKDLEDYWIEVNRLENDGDRAHRAVLIRLFSGEFGALDVLKLHQVANELEAAIDAFEVVANTVETILVKES